MGAFPHDEMLRAIYRWDWRLASAGHGRHLQPVSERTRNNISSRHKAGAQAVLAYRLGQMCPVPSLNSALSQDLSHAARNKRMPEDAITVCPTLKRWSGMAAYIGWHRKRVCRARRHEPR